jgi:hypothetical protein
MIRKPTLIVLLCAIVLGAAVYYFDWVRGNNQKPPADSEKLAFSIPAADVVSLTITHPAKPGDTPVSLEKRSGVWQIVQPIQTQADQSTADGIVDQLATDRIAQSEPGSADRRKAYGLDPAQLSLEFRLQNGAKHSLLIGDKDFTGASVYSIIDGGQTVSLVPQALLTSADKPLDDLRDRTVLYIDSDQAASLALKNSSGELAATKEKDGWKLTMPSESLADKSSIDSLLSTVADAKMTGVASETAENLAKYGLSSPAISFAVTDEKGQKSTLLIGKKDGDSYFARDVSRPMVFRVSADVYSKLSERFGELRNKTVVRLDPADIQRIEVHNANGDIIVSSGKDKPGEWTIQEPEAQKGKSAASWRVLDPFTSLRAEEVIDHPSPELTTKLANPAIRAILTDTAGKQVTLRISKADGDFVYAQTSDSPLLYKLKKQVLDDLNFKPSDLVL